MLKELINQHYADKVKNRKQDHFYITDAGKCPRQVFFKFKDYPRKEPEPRVMRIFDHGDYTHLRLSSVLFSLGIVRAVEVDIPPQSNIHGRADAIIGIEGKPYVVDFKTCSHFKFTKMNQPQPDNAKQLQLYLHYFKIPQGILLYEDKNTQEIKEFVVDYDKESAQDILNKFEKLKQQIENDEIPSVPKDIEKWRCKYCDYREECQKIEKSKLET